MGVWKPFAGAGVAAALTFAVFGLPDIARAQGTDAFASPGKVTYDQACAACHDAPEAGGRAPSFASLRKMTAQQITAALTTGVMKGVGDSLDRRQIAVVAAYLATPDPAPVGRAWLDDIRCPTGGRTIDLSARPAQVGFGVDADNSRRMSARQAGLTTKDAARLEVAWALAFPRTVGLRSQGVVVGSTLFYPTGQAGYLLALDTRTGCVKWAVATESNLRSSLAYGRLGARGPQALVASDNSGHVTAYDPRDGRVIWRVDPRHDKQVPLSGTPLFAGDRILVPISSADVGLALSPGYGCCKTHGALAAINAADGKVLWTWHTMPDARPLGRKNTAGVETYGPSGAPIWSSPAVDLKAGVAYTATGEGNSPPDPGTIDAIIALDLATGRQKWVFQGLAADFWHMGCPIGRPPAGAKLDPNCFFAAESVMLDQDFGGGPLIWKGKGGKSLILGGQKSGHVWALDSATGRPVWRHQFGKGSPLGGVHWGLATDGVRVFAPIYDPVGMSTGGAPGLYAVDIGSGQLAWSWTATPDCTGERKTRVMGCAFRHGLSPPPLVIDGAVVAASPDGRFHVFEAATGKLLATHDTARPFETLNKIPGRGGSIDAAGPFAGDGMLFVPSGYVSFGQTPGNVLVAYRPKK